jgi:hypothetical protein
VGDAGGDPTSPTGAVSRPVNGPRGAAPGAPSDPGPTITRPVAPATRLAQAAGVLLLSAGSVYAEMAILLPSPGAAAVPPIAVLVSAALAVRWRLHREPAFLLAWVVISAGFAVLSATTGFYNGLTDEPYATPAFAAQWWPHLYSTPIRITYEQYGTGPIHLSAYYVYLPLLTLIQVPGLDYRWVSLVAWALAVYLQRTNGTAVVAWGSLYVGLLAANGFNDFVPILVLTLTFVSLSGWKGKVAEFVGLALKQFANLIVVAHHLYHRRWRAAALAVVVTAAVLTPFLLVDPLRVWCGALLIAPGNCSSFLASVETPVSAGNQAVYAHLNYYLWPIWVVATFVPRWVARTREPEYVPSRREAAALLDRHGRPMREGSEDLSFLLAVMWVRLRAAVQIRKRARRDSNPGLRLRRPP